MIQADAEIAIMGAGFAGSVMALVLKQLGRRVVLIERGRHPRFAIGESSTPLTNLALEEISRDYDLPRLLPLAEYGPWRRTYPELACGLKRGFTFFQHHADAEYQPGADHANELLVASSANDETADTHWFREHFDHFMLQEAQAAGIPYLDETAITRLDHDDLWRLYGERSGEAVHVTARFVIDATGPGGFLATMLRIDTRPTVLRTNSWTLFSHFENVGTWESVLLELGGNVSDHPFPCDDSVVHHLLDDGWMWVIPFSNGVTSIGFTIDGDRHASDPRLTPEEEWTAVLRRYPSIGRQLRNVRRVQPWFRTGRLQRRAERIAGPGWAMLPHAAFFFDPLFSVGNALTLQGVQRLARILEGHWDRPEMTGALMEYERRVHREVEFLDWLIHGCYRSFGRFPLFASYALIYFAGAIHSENQHRQGKATWDEEFLSSHLPEFRTAMREAYQSILRLTIMDRLDETDVAALRVQIDDVIGLLGVKSLLKPARENVYPFIA